jgi:hypothetical protein
MGIEDRPIPLDALAALHRGDVLLVAKRGARVVSAAGEGTDSDDPATLLMRRLIAPVGAGSEVAVPSRASRTVYEGCGRRGRIGCIDAAEVVGGLTRTRGNGGEVQWTSPPRRVRGGRTVTARAGR